MKATNLSGRVPLVNPLSPVSQEPGATATTAAVLRQYSRNRTGASSLPITVTKAISRTHGRMEDRNTQTVQWTEKKAESRKPHVSRRDVPERFDFTDRVSLARLG